MSMLCLMMLIAAPTGRTLPEGIDLTFTFDSPTIRLGDLAYCKVQIRNQGEVAREIGIPSLWTGLWFQVQPMDELLAVDDSREWSIGGGGGFGGGGTIVLLPGESLVAWMRVPLFTAESLRDIGNRSVPQLRLLAMYLQVVTHYPVATLPIRGTISKHPREIDLVSKLYVPYGKHPATPAAWEAIRDRTPSFGHSEGMSQMPRMYESPEGLQWLRTQLVEESAMYRAVQILQAQQACTFANPEDKEKVMKRLLAELQPCGPAEKEWYTRGELRSTFSYSRDYQSRKMIAEHYPETLWPYERYTEDGRLVPVTLEEGRYGRRPGVSVPE